MKIDAEQMTDITSEISVSEETLEMEYEPPSELTDAVVPKAKAKRAPRKQLQQRM